MTHHIIRTPEELEALDPDTMLLSPDSDLGRVCSYMNGPISPPRGGAWPFPSVVIATGAQVRAARRALELELRAYQSIGASIRPGWTPSPTPAKPIASECSSGGKANADGP